MAQLRIGTCSWKFPSWHGLVYSAPKGINYLARYAQRYDTVEIDQWFWSLFGPDSVKLPLPRDVSEYRAAVPEGFRFTVKVPNSVTLTHFYSRSKASPSLANPHFLSPDLFVAFLHTLEPLHDLLGPLMFQFEYLNKQKMPSQEEFQGRFEAFLQRIPPSFAYAIETRNGNYLNQAFFEFLQRCRLRPVFIQGYWMPQVTEVYATWRSLILGHDTVVVRLHGGDREAMEERSGKRWDQVIAAKDEELRGVVDMVQDLLSSGVNVYLNVNNHYEGSAPLTIERLRKLLGLEPAPAPPVGRLL